MKRSCWVTVGLLFWTVSAAAEPVRALPAPPGNILDLRANAAGDLYVRTATNVLHLALDEPDAGWKALPLDRVVDLSENAGREVFARQDLKTRHAIHRLTGADADRVATVPPEPWQLWYVDSVDRVWLQTKERLLVVGKDDTLLERAAGRSNQGAARFNPCEWKPGHLGLFFDADMVWASSNAITVGTSPAPFAKRPPTSRLLAVGCGKLAVGTENRSGTSRGTSEYGGQYYLIDPQTPDNAFERVEFDWHWFNGIAAAPDGRVLVLAENRHSYQPAQYSLVWLGADGHEQVRIKASETAVGAWCAPGRPVAEPPIMFASNSVGFAVMRNGMLAVFRPEEANLLTPVMGLPLQRVEHVAVVGDDLILAGDGEIVAWRTTEPLQPDTGFDERTEWPLAGPCARDGSGRLWAFLRDFPDKLSCHDGNGWRHIDMHLGDRKPCVMTADDRDRLQISFVYAGSGSSLVMDGTVTNWPNATLRAWVESIKMGATRFCDGSPYRPRHVTGGADDMFWTYDGRSLRTGGRMYSYDESPPYRFFGPGPHGTCYRGGGGRLWRYAGGRWSPTYAPAPLSIGPDGVRADDPGPGRPPLVYDGQLKLPLPTPSAASADLKPRSLTLQGREAFIAGPGGGWLGTYRVFGSATYAVAGRAYPGTNGHYLVADNTLRFQRGQKLGIEGEVLEDGKLRRLACRITGSKPLYKPRLLAFLDGEFNDSIASPDGVDLPSLQPGLHELLVYAADGYGVVSDEPLRASFEGGEPVKADIFELDDAWTLKPHRLQFLPTSVGGRSVQGRSLEIDADGIVWILVKDGVVGIDLAERKAAFHRLAAGELVAARGRVWARKANDRSPICIPLYEFRFDAVRHATDLYNDLTPAWRRIFAGGAGGIWTLSNRGACRWDGERMQYWEREMAFNARVWPIPGGVVIRSFAGCYLYRDGELSAALPWSTGARYLSNPLHTLGPDHLIKPQSDAIIDLDTCRIIDRTSPPGEVFRTDAAGNLYVWNKGQLSRFSDGELTETLLGPCAPPSRGTSSYTANQNKFAQQFLATAGGTVIYESGLDRLIAVRPDEGAAEYGWEQGILPSRLCVIREAPDGRIWILRGEQLLLYDPDQPADTIPSAWPGWRDIRVADSFGTGAFGHIWYRDAHRPTMICTDGTNETTWVMKRWYGHMIVSDQGAAAVFSEDQVHVLVPGEEAVRVKDQQSAVLELVRRGGKRFEGDETFHGHIAPAVAADGRVYFRGQIWDGETWHRLPNGRVSIDPRGELYLLCRERGSPPVVYRVDGVKAISLGQAERCLVDAYGLRWYDPALMETDPDCLPVWHGGKGGAELSSALDTTRAKIDPNHKLQAFPLGDGRFFVQIRASLYLLDKRGLTALPHDSVPCGAPPPNPDHGIEVWPLAEGRWAFSTRTRLFISPPDWRFSP